MAKKKRDEKEIEEVCKLLPKTPPPTILETMKQRQKAEKLVYRCGYYREPLTGEKKKAALVHCTHCGESYYLSYTNAVRNDNFGFIDPFDQNAKSTGKTCVCPECGVGAEALHISHMRGTYDIASSYFMTIHNIRGHFVSLSWKLIKQCDKEGQVSWELHEYEGIALIDGRPIRYTGYTTGIFGCWLPEWTARAVWKDNGDEWDREEIFMDRETYDSSDASKTGLDQFIIDQKVKIRVAAYLQLWSEDPQVENLVRSGYAPYVSKILEAATVITGYYGYGSARSFSVKEAEKYFDKKKVRPHEMIGLEKAEAHFANEWSLACLEFYKYMIREKSVKLTDQQLKWVGEFGFESFKTKFEEVKKILHFDPPIVRTLNYLKAQRARWGSIIDMSYLFDYWEMTKKVHHGLPPQLVWPKRLISAHDLAVLRRKEKENAAINENICRYAKELQQLSFEDEETGLLIRPVSNQKELINEGDTLSHCVAGYASRIAKRETAIFLIRHIDDPSTPFFTLEFKNGTVEQNRGEKNCDRTPEVVLFEAKWINHIMNLKKGTKKNGKRTDTKSRARQRAGA